MTRWEIPPAGWLPVSLEGRWVRFKNFGPRRLERRNYQNWVAATPALDEGLFAIETLAAIAPERAVPPAGFIFHMSRCGSTLVSNALSCTRGSVVLSEPGVFMTCLWGAAERPETALMHLALARGLLAAFGARRTGEEERLFVKLNPFDALFVPLIRRAFPGVPWIFMSRDPVEVMVSNLRKGFNIALPPERIAFASGISTESLSTISESERFARLLGNLCSHAADSAAPGGAFLDYADLAPDTLTPIFSHFGLTAVAEDLTAARNAFKVYSKDLGQQQSWIPDAREKQREASDAIRDAADKFARSDYERVLALSRSPEFSLMGSTIPASPMHTRNGYPE